MISTIRCPGWASPAPLCRATLGVKREKGWARSAHVFNSTCSQNQPGKFPRILRVGTNDVPTLPDFPQIVEYPPFLIQDLRPLHCTLPELRRYTIQANPVNPE